MLQQEGVQLSTLVPLSYASRLFTAIQYTESFPFSRSVFEKAIFTRLLMKFSAPRDYFIRSSHWTLTLKLASRLYRHTPYV